MRGASDQRADDAPFAHNVNALQASFSSAQRVWRKQAARGGVSAKAPPVGCISIGRVKRSKQRGRPACRGIPGQGIHARGSHTEAHAAAHDLSRVVNNNVADHGAGDMLRVTQHEAHQAMHAAGDQAPARRLLAQSAPARNFPNFSISSIPKHAPCSADNYIYQALHSGRFGGYLCKVLPCFAPKLERTFLREARMICRE